MTGTPHPSRTARLLVAGWIGSTNLGDELVFAGLRALADTRGIRLAAISEDPDATRAIHGVGAVHSRAPLDVVSAIGSADGLLFGGGGLLQDETSHFNLPYHLARPAMARAHRRPWAGIGLGAGPLHSRGAREAMRIFRSAVAVSVRDPESGVLLHRCGLDDVKVGADLAWALHDDALPVASADSGEFMIALRPWTGGRASTGGAPVAANDLTGSVEDDWIRAAAAAITATGEETGLIPHFVALQTDRDGDLADRISQHMHVAAMHSRPTLDHLVPTMARGRFAVAMRYHGVVTAALAGIPSVVLPYSPKASSLAAQLDLPRVTPDVDGFGGLPGAAAQLMRQVADPAASARFTKRRDLLVTQSRAVNGAVLDELLAAI